MSNDPVIEISPRVRFGHPHLRGIPTDAVAGMVWAGEAVETVCDEYDMTRHEVLLCCWWEGSQGEYRRQWKTWATEAQPMLGGWVKPFDLAAIPDPPSRAEMGETARR
ncbi:DUF433 domain-containing protein [Micromonospora haikouensis]|uniref:DUF433 domain-containing protein n=1 Tax=Micromonospora haikouensis TaxID=686309 RepID=UPI00369ED3C1